MVYTLTMHPAVDLFLHAQGDVPERRGAAVQAGGKGVNVSRFLRRLGRPSRCVVLCGGARGQFLCASLAEEGLDVLPVDDPKGFCRINLKCTGAHEQALDGRGRAGANAAERVLSLLASLLRSGDLLAACGSLPDGIDSGFYAAAVRLARKKDAQIIVDASGDALREALEASPSLLRCNRAEASAFAAGTDAEDAAREAVARGAAAALVSDGENGAYLCADGRVFFEQAKRIEVLHTVGAGDALTAACIDGILRSLRGQALLSRCIAFAADVIATPLPGAAPAGR